MFKHLLRLTLCLFTVLAAAQEATPTRVVEDTVRMDGENPLSLPASVLGDQKDYTIEFEVKRPSEVPADDKITLVSNTDEAGKAGLALKYFPPPYNAFWLMINGHRTVEYRGFLDDKVNRISIVAKDGQLLLFRNSLLLATTEAVAPSQEPQSEAAGGGGTAEGKVFGRSRRDASTIPEFAGGGNYAEAPHVSA